MTAQHEVAVIVPTYGEHHLTHAVVSQLLIESPEVIYVIDSLGDYEPVAGETVIRPAERLRWAAACNEGLRTAISAGHTALCLLNNDVVLSKGFVHGLMEAWASTGAGIMCPTYDHSWRHQWPTRTLPTTAARDYRPVKLERDIPFADGTCLFMPRRTLELVGLLDDTTWPFFNWGCDQDFALRARSAGLDVMVTHRAYLNHRGRQTVRLDPDYSDEAAFVENCDGMIRKWGDDWTDKLFAGYPELPRAGLRQSELEALVA